MNNGYLYADSGGATSDSGGEVSLKFKQYAETLRRAVTSLERPSCELRMRETRYFREAFSESRRARTARGTKRAGATR